MFQHRWALWSGLLGATASCLAKMAVSLDDPHNPLQWIYQQCDGRLTTDLDVVASRAVYRILGDLMIKYRINLNGFYRPIREGIQDVAIFFRIFEVDWCQCLMLAPCIVCFATMLLMNAYMIASFLKAMQASGSVVGTAVSTAANFSMSAVYGYILWKERFPTLWYFGFSCVILGVLILSTVQVNENENDGFSQSSSKKQAWMNSPTLYAGAVSGTTRKPAATPAAKPAHELKQYGEQQESPVKVRSFFRQTQRPLSTATVDRSFANECALCSAQLFDETTGESRLAIADLSPNCYHVMHSRCLKNQQQQHPGQNSNCPMCNKTVHMWVSAKQAAHFAGFWMDRIERCLHQMKSPPTDQPLPVDVLREKLRQDDTLNDSQKRYIDEDPTGLGKGLVSALEWGGTVDYNFTKIGHTGWSSCLVSQGLWKYDARRDELWFWEWGIHPKQRCDQCQFKKRPLPVSCMACEGSSEQAHYCTEACQKRDWQRHKMTCLKWQREGPNATSR